MPGKLDLVVAPWNDLDPTQAKGHGIYRDDPYAVTLKFWTDATKTTPRDLHTGTWQAQIRPARLKGSTAGAPLAQFTVDATNAATGVLVISLSRAQTVALPLSTTPVVAYWEIQDETGGETLLTGRIAIFDDAGRAA